VDIYELDAARLCNLVYATLIDEPGAFADRAEVRRQLDTALKRADSPRSARGSARAVRRVGISAVQARRMAADLEEYDSRIKGGRMTGSD